VQSSEWRQTGRLRFEARSALRLMLLSMWDKRVSDPRSWAALVRKVGEAVANAEAS
jgi:hypothetical protein